MNIDTLVIQDVDKVNRTIVRQYTAAVKMLDRLFKKFPDQCYKVDGIGCCEIPTKRSESYLIGPARDGIIKMRNEILQSRKSVILENTPCAHLGKDGCTLGELKSPLCIAHYCGGDLDYVYDRNYVTNALGKILIGGLNPHTGLYNPEKNTEVVHSLKHYIRGVATRASNAKRAKNESRR